MTSGERKKGEGYRSKADRIEETLRICAELLQDTAADGAIGPMDEVSLPGMREEFPSSAGVTDSSTDKVTLGSFAAAIASVSTSGSEIPAGQGEKNTAGFEPSPSTAPAASSEWSGVASSLQELTGRVAPISEKEIARAAFVLSEIIGSSNPAQKVAEHLAEIDQLLPALVELNIRQAEMEGRQDLTSGLRALQTNINLQLAFHKGQKEPSNGPEVGSGRAVYVTGGRQRFSGKILILSGETYSESRAGLAREGLVAAGCQVSLVSQYFLPKPGEFDVAIACNPHVTPGILETMAACAALHIPIVVDLDSDFEEMPITHPAYREMGLGKLENARAYTAALLLSSLVTTPSETLAEVMRNSGYKARVVTESWSRQNHLWEKVGPRHRSLNLGWVSKSGQMDDLLPIRRVIIRAIREFPQAQLVICGDSQVYQVFDTLPENRRMFIPEGSPEDYPYMLDQMDILMIPLRNIPFNKAQSDRMLMEVGVKGIPWIASPVPPSFEQWGVGGILANSTEEWHSYLRQLIQEKDVRVSMGQSGREKANSREARQGANGWLDAIEEILLSQ